jgi:acyl-homoserine-lactone acylase
MLFRTNSLWTQIHPDSHGLIIARDSFGVPHIFAPTDAQCAYGLAWATCEDHFALVQEALLPSRGRLGRVKGKEGIVFDYALRFMGLDTFIHQRYEKDLSPEFREVAEAYVRGVNDYARAHPEEILDPALFPVKPQDVIAGYCVSGALMSGVGMALKAIRENRISLFYAPNETGSNAIAIAPYRTEDGRSWLLLNSHQPNEGRFAWYEAHICSEEGTNTLGALFPGGVTIFTGANEHLGWAHTTNYHTFGDIYALKVKNGKYLFGEQWLPFKRRKIRLWLKLGNVKIPLRKKLFYSVHGPALKQHGQWYALRFPAWMDIRSAEQWWRMSKAKSLEEFETILKMDALPLFNVIYADAEGNIFLHSGGKTPRRDTALVWKQPMPGEASRALWKDFLPYESKTRILNPSCGYLYNANNTPAHYTHYTCEDNQPTYWPGFQLFDYNRGDRLRALLGAVTDRFTRTHFWAIKNDPCYAFDGTYQRNFAALYSLDEKKYPRLAEAITMLKNWNRCGGQESETASLALITHHFLTKKYRMPFAMLMIKKEPLTEKECVEALKKARAFMLKKYGTLHVPLGHIQRLMRDTLSFPVSGLREVPRAIDTRLYDKRKGLWKVTGGDTYILWARFGVGGPELESVNTYGASGRPGSPHYTDQMKLFAMQKTKPMTLDKSEVLRNARRVYRPQPMP